MADGPVAAAAAPVVAPPRSYAELVAEKKPFYEKRIQLFEGYSKREQDKVAQAKAANVPIQVVLPDGKVKQAVKDVTTPFDIANEISKSLAKKVQILMVPCVKHAQQEAAREELNR